MKFYMRHCFQESALSITITDFNAANFCLNDTETSALTVVWGNNFRNINPFLRILK